MYADNIPRQRGRALQAVYVNARLNEPCPNCGAVPYAYCTRDDGHIRRLPCLVRMDCEQQATEAYR